MDNVATSTQQADSNGRISYTYTGGWSTHTFDVNATAATCSLSLDNSSIYYGKSATLTWTSTRGLSASLNNGIGSVTLNGSTAVSPSVGTHTYTLSITAGGSAADKTCSTTLTVKGAGNGAPVGLISGSGTGSGSHPVSIIPTALAGAPEASSTSQQVATTTVPVAPSSKGQSASSYRFARNLTIGDSGADVIALQQLLITSGNNIPAGATGYFGKETEAALAAYQKANEINPPAGYFGPLTRASIAESPSPVSGGQSVSATSATSHEFTRNLSLHDSGVQVRQLQMYLNAHGFTVAASGPGSIGDETDYFGPATYAALVRFQNAHASGILAPVGLVNGDGYFGSSTRTFVNSH